MTVSSTTSRVSYSTNGSTTLFQFPYYFLEDEDLEVVLKNNSTGAETILVLTTNYTVTGAGNAAGGSITTLSTYASGYTLSIFRNPQVVQETDLEENDSLPAESLEMALDKLTMIAQRHDDLLERSVTLSDGTAAGSFDPTLPEVLTADTVVKINSAGDGFEEGPSAADIADAQANAAIATAAAATATAAAATVTSAFYRDVVYKTSADSPVTISSSDNGKLYSFDTSGGAISVTLPQISSITPPFNWAFVLKTAGNNLTINRAGSDTIAGATSKTVSTAGVGAQLVGDTDASPDDWSVLDFGTVADGALTLAKLGTQISGPGIAKNYTITSSLSSNAVTFAVKTLAGTDPSATDPVYVYFRNGTAGTGNYVKRTITSALSITISSGSTLGHSSGLDCYGYGYFLDNSGTVELAVAGSRVFDEASLQTTTAEGGAGAADSKTTLYSTTARTSKPILFAWRFKSNQATAGTWASAISEISLYVSSRNVIPYSDVWLQTGNSFGSESNNKIRRFTTTNNNVGSAITYADNATTGSTFTINEDGVYSIHYYEETSSGPNNFGISRNTSSRTTSITIITATERLAMAATQNGTSNGAICSVTAHLVAGDIIRPHCDGGGTFVDTNRTFFRITQVAKFN